MLNQDEAGMSILIKIDPYSVKKNKNAGDTTSTIKTGFTKRSVEFEAFDKSLDAIKKIIGKEVHISSSSIYISNEGSRTEIKGLVIDMDITDEEILKRIRVFGDSGCLDFDHDIETVHHDPVADYSFKYEDTDVECNGCGSKFMHNELESDDDGYSSTVCPKCGESDCCEVEYQSLSDFRKKKSK